ncbi:hypothetical protein Tco_0465805 [Tanacetum coccineum]
MPPRMRTRSVGRPAAESLGGGTGVQVGRGGRGRKPREGNDKHVDDLNGQGSDHGMGANGGIEGVNGNVEGANRGVSNRGNVGNQNGNVVNEKVQENVGNVIVKMQPVLFHELARMVATSEPKTIHKALQISRALTDEAVRNGSIKKVEKKRDIW